VGSTTSPAYNVEPVTNTSSSCVTLRCSVYVAGCFGTVYITVQSWCCVSVDLLFMSATVVHWFASVVIIRGCGFTSSVNYIMSVCRHVVYVIKFCAVRSIEGVNRVSAPWCRVSLCAGIVSAYLFIGYARRTVGMSVRINYHVSPHDRRRARVKCVVGQLLSLCTRAYLEYVA